MSNTLLPENEMTKIRRLAGLLHRCRNVLVITGAGMSADSGLPTYRGIGGLYNDKSTGEGLPIEEALSGEMMAARPEISWKHIADIESKCRHASFNRGHEVLAQMESYFSRFWILTQNVDGFHQAAGSKNVIDLHGDIHCLACMRCDYTEWVKDYSGLKSMPPLCPKCQSAIRPRVVLFNEMLPKDKLARLQAEIERGFDMVFSIGTSSVFPYIIMPILMAVKQGIPTVEINPQKTVLSSQVTFKIQAGAAQTLDALWGEFRQWPA